MCLRSDCMVARFAQSNTFVVTCSILLLLLSRAAFSAPDAATTPFDQQLHGFLKQHCVECHSGEKPKGDLRLDEVSTNLADDAVRKQWLTVRKRILSGEMPPKSKPRPAPAEIERIGDGLQSRIDQAIKDQRAAQGRVVLRRLNRVEYENTVRDLLGVSIELKELLPPDSSSDGFDNVGDALHVSSFLMERYLEAAEKVLNVAISNLPQPPVIKKRYDLKEERIVKITTEDVYLHRDDSLVMYSSSPWNSITVGQFYPSDRGQYRVRISAYGFQSAGKPVTFRIDVGPMLMGTKNHLVSYFDAPADQSKPIEFVDNFEARNHFRISPYGLANAQTVTKTGAPKYTGAGLGIDWVEVEGPLHAAWPPESHRRIFGDLEQAPSPNSHFSHRVEVVSKDPQADADRILRRFARRAFRRAVSDAEIKPFTDLVAAKLNEQRTFEQAVRVGLMAIMIAPDFLFLREEPGPLNDFALANRLSYFLWSTMPDEELLALAEQGKLRTTAPATDAATSILGQQVERMLRDPKSQQFVENFVGQWLGLRDIDFTEPTHILYPEYDDMLKVSMVKETELFFAELLKENLSVANFLASDFTMLNGRLAKHYGIPGVDGWEFHRTPLPPDSHRGGVLTMASVMKVTANGTSTSPVMRGAWVLDRILGTPPPRPPENIAALEPDIRGATTIREQLAKHRQIESCAACHRLIDPPGFALESFDVIGGYREYYRSTGNGKPVTIDGRKMHYLQGLAIDPADTLADGRAFKNVDELKQLLLANKDQFARSLTTKLLTYATGGPPDAVDQPHIDAIVARIRDKNYGFRSLIHEIVQSQLFQSK